MTRVLYKPGAGGDFTVWAAFPGSNSFALSSIGYLWIYKAFDEMEGVNAVRVCVDTKTVPPADLIAFSFTFDMDFLTIFTMLERFKIPLRAAERDTLVYAGGPVVTANPLPYSDFFDFFIIGDGEGINERIVEICKQRMSKEDTLRALSEVEGIFVPTIPKPVKKLTNRLEQCVYTPILSEEAFFANTFIVEISRGCANRCGFCIASYINLPLRCTAYDDLLKTVDLGLSHTNKIALLGAQVSAHPHFVDILRHIQGAQISVSSLRVDAVTPEIVQLLAGQKSITLAIEAGSERLRKVINKNLTEEQIFEAVRICRENGLKGIKFYAMLGLPTETWEDIEAFVSLAKRMRNVSFGFSTFVPKPHTPFQFCPREDTKSLETKINYLKKEFHKLGIKASFSSPKWDYWQSVLSLGDADLGDFLLDTYKLGGKLGAFSAAAKQRNVKLHEHPIHLPHPWDFIEMQPGKEFLAKEFKRLTLAAG